MTKATDKLLGELHGKLASAMLEALDTQTVAAELLDEFHGEMPGKVVAFLEKLSAVNPALLTAVSKFLKDNSITCAVEDSSELSELQQRLQAKRKNVGNIVQLHE